MAESTQHKLSRVRPPRVQITYDVEIGGAIQKKELPFVVGIMSDLAGKTALPRLKDRKFIEIDRDNFNDVLRSINPTLSYRVSNTLKDDNTKLNVSLSFNHIDDFEPISVVTQIEPLRKLYEARQRLTDLIAKLDGNDALDALLQDVVSKTEELEELKTATVSGGTE